MIYSSAMLFLQKASLFSFGPFFTYPWKPIMNMMIGDTYPVAYKHFWDQHRHKTNLAMHVICLFFQVFGNFSLLSAIDAKLGTQQFISFAAAALWILLAVLPPSEAPAIVKAGSSAAILGALFYSSQFNGPQIEIYGLLGVFIVYLAHLVTHKTFTLGKQGTTIAVVLLTKWFMFYKLGQSDYAGMYSAHSNEITIGWILSLVGLSFLKNPLTATVALGSVGSTLLSVLLNSPAMYLFNCAFTATLLQGLAHSLSGEMPTLIKLESEQDQAKKVSFEYAHAVFFPNLLLHAIYDTFVAKKGSSNGDKNKLKTAMK